MTRGRRVNFRKNPIKRSDVLAFNAIGYAFISIIAAFCLIPFLFVVSGSITKEQSLYMYGYRLIPVEFSLEAYDLIFKAPTDILRSYSVTIMLTVSGTALGLFVTSMTAYVLARQDFKYRGQMSFFFYFTTLFSGGMVSNYILMIRYLHLKNNFLALLLPGMLNVFYILIMRNFTRSIPDSITESAKIDGAGDFTIFIRLILPLMGPSLASIGLFIALGFWNNWYNAMLYIEKQSLFPLQFLLYKMINSVRFAAIVASEAGVAMPQMPEQSLKLAMTVVAIGPIIFVYPFVQKYFISGITIGSVKG
jgi:putative aldouronate transport system permease protein